jgi:uncharacterized protein YkwD
LQAAAIRRCNDFSHTPCGRPFGSAYDAAGYSVATHDVAENIAWGTGSLGTAEATLRAWLGSPEHRRNMLDGTWRKLGVAVLAAPRFAGARGVTLWVAEFGAP